MTVLKKITTSIVFILFVFGTASSQNHQNNNSYTICKELKVPIPEDLCGHQNEKKIRERFLNIVGNNIVPCGHGVVRFLEFTISKKKVLIIVEQDNRPSYLSGGPGYRSYAIVNNKYYIVTDEFLNSIWPKEKYSTKEIVNLLVAVVMLQHRPNIILNNEQKNALVQKWPKTENTFKLDPPGLYKNKKGHLLLQAWITYAYYERGVSCKYIIGYCVNYNPTTGIKLECNHDYADGTNLNQPCGKPLPGDTKKTGE